MLVATKANGTLGSESGLNSYSVWMTVPATATASAEWWRFDRVVELKTDFSSSNPYRRHSRREAAGAQEKHPV
jgi:hypothetical protein